VTTPAGNGWLGHDPDVLGSLANERNGLAWQRTALAWLSAGAAVARYFASDGLLTGRAFVGWSMLLVGVAVWLAGTRQYHRQASKLRADLPAPVSVASITTISVITTVAIAAVVVIEIVSW
jgi:uncharacterized membrane protein YidH (DUF202 family)